MANPNFQLLVDAAKLLKPILGELVFVGGCTTALPITDKAAADVRPTYDVDAIAEITSYVGYAKCSERLKTLGFREDSRESSFEGRSKALTAPSRGPVFPLVEYREGRLLS
jgi:hypothetical protein